MRHDPNADDACGIYHLALVVSRDESVRPPILALISDYSLGYAEIEEASCDSELMREKSVREVSEGFVFYVEALERASPKRMILTCIDLISLCGMHSEKAAYFLRSIVDDPRFSEYRGRISFLISEIEGVSAQ
ncbi:hypothetical protein AB0K15_13715 [Amycolatopsis sp. NPDC049253]|uniref:hypothetical protein n=1 Tax=Amycolatopsis sp. NPDC049253 TaxID=3155274 RepID=UPI0034318925